MAFRSAVVSAPRKGDAPKKKRKPADLLSSVVRETASPAAIELLRGNAPFALPAEMGGGWVALLLRSESIGGLSAKHKRDEDKGHLIGLIDSDQVQTVATPEMLDAECFAIIPTAETLTRVEEFTILTRAPFEWCRLRTSPTSPGELVTETGAQATFDEAVAVQEGRRGVADVVGSQLWVGLGEAAVDGDGYHASAPADAELSTSGPLPPTNATTPNQAPTSDTPLAEQAWGQPEAHAAFADTDPGDAMFDVEPSAGVDLGVDVADEEFEDLEGDFEEDEIVPVFDDEELGDDEPVDDFAGTPVFEVPSEIEIADAADTTGTQEGSDEVPVRAQATQTAEEVVVTENQIRSQIARRFKGDDLELEVDLSEFNRALNIGAPIVQFETPEGVSGWLSDLVATQIAQANTELRHLRESHNQALTRTFTDLMSRHMEEVIAGVSLTRPGTRYHGLSAAAKADYASRLENQDQAISARRTQITEVYEAEAETYGAKYAAQAVAQFKSRNRARLEREIADAATEIKVQAENDLDYATQQILSMRQSEALFNFERGRTKVMELCGERQAEQAAAEQALLERWTSTIQQVIDDNRKADITQAQVLADQLARRDEIVVLKAEHEQTMAALRAEAEDRLRATEADMDRVRAEAIATLEAREAEWERKLAAGHEELERSHELVASLRDMDEAFRTRAKARDSEFKAAQSQHRAEIKAIHKEHARSHRQFLILMFSLAVLMLFVGWLVGAFVS